MTDNGVLLEMNIVNVLHLIFFFQICWKLDDWFLLSLYCPISNKFEQNQMQNVDYVHFQQNPIISEFW